MIIVRVKDRDIEKALRQYKYKRSRSKLDRELIERKEYTKPTTRRRRQKLKAINKNKFLKND
jgi:small subunit ribosomal protein S21